MNLPPLGSSASGYRGRFAPTPSGPLHLGSLLTALASWLDARAHGGRWLLRIDDLDRARCPPGMESTILRQLEAHGLEWDEPPRRQSEHLDEYRQAHADLADRQRVYACRCTRAIVVAEGRPGPDDLIYSGRCRELRLDLSTTVATRLRVTSGLVEIDDAVQGPLRRHADSEIGDFVLRRADGVTGYQLACVVDEAAQGITRVLRGADLIGSSLRQRLLQSLLGLPSPSYVHLPVLVEPDGRKLSKQNGAIAIDVHRPAENLRRCLRALGQSEPAATSPVHELLRQATREWRLGNVPRQLSQPSPTAP